MWRPRRHGQTRAPQTEHRRAGAHAFNGPARMSVTRDPVLRQIVHGPLTPASVWGAGWHFWQ
jgi:hypothetical protein